MRSSFTEVLTKKFLEEQYLKLNKPAKQIAAELKICKGTIVKYINIYNLQKRAKFFIPKEEIYNLYIEENLSSYEIADLYNIDAGCIQRKLKKYNIPTKIYNINIIGEKFGKLTVLKSCECGKEKFCLKDRLLDGRNTSCGCNTNYVYAPDREDWGGYKDIPAPHWRKIKHAAKKRKLEFNLSIVDAWDIYIKQNKKCVYTNIDLKFENNSKYMASLDRINSNKGYSKENVQWICYIINIMKSNLSEEEFINLCDMVIKNKK